MGGPTEKRWVWGGEERDLLLSRKDHCSGENRAKAERRNRTGPMDSLNLSCPTKHEKVFLLRYY